MSWEDEIVIRDVTNAGLVVSDRIGREISSQLDLEESLEASRYASHPYSTHPREVPFILHSLQFLFFRFNSIFHVILLLIYSMFIRQSSNIQFNFKFNEIATCNLGTLQVIGFKRVIQ